MNHLDLFSGIGGFAYAVDQVWPGSTHVFCDNNLFCQKVLRKHWPESKIYGDIKHITEGFKTDIVTGGFPCQPFSGAGKKRGVKDKRYLWPEMLRVIRLSKPSWIIGENVVGIVKVALDTILSDLESEGYATQAFIIPACAINAPHRRDRVWIISHSTNDGCNGTENTESNQKGNGNNQEGTEQVCQPKRADSLRFETSDWKRDWVKVATEAHRMDDGLPYRMDRIKALGNAIVPQVAMEIMLAIKGCYQVITRE